MMQGLRSRLAISVLAVLATSCDDRLSSGQGGGPIVIPTPTPTASPTPSPTPTPTPSATPTPKPTPGGYVSGFDFARDLHLLSPVAELSYERVVTSAQSWTDTADKDQVRLIEIPSAELSWNAADRTASLRVAASLSLYPPSSILNEATDSKLFTVSYGQGSFDLLSWSGISQPYGNLGEVRYRQMACPANPSYPYRCQVLQRTLLAGAQTLPADLPGSGRPSYTGTIYFEAADIAYGLNVNVPVRIDIDWAAGTVSGSGAGGAAIALTGALDRSLTNRIHGTIRIDSLKLDGEFVGDMFGDQAHQMGLLFIGTTESGRHVTALLIANQVS
jgi:hypothetical protein